MSNTTLLRSTKDDRSWYDEVPLSALTVTKPCSRCFPGEKLEEIDVRLVSPRGVVHAGRDYGMTWCGRDATGPGWWWAL